MRKCTMHKNMLQANQGNVVFIRKKAITLCLSNSLCSKEIPCTACRTTLQFFFCNFIATVTLMHRIRKGLIFLEFISQ